MNNHNIISLIKYDFEMQKKSIIIWLCSVFSITLLYTGLFNSVKDIANVKFENLPDSLLELFGMGEFSNLSDYSYYLGTIYSLIIIAIIIFSTSLVASLFNKEETNKTIELLYSMPISRGEIFISKIILAVFSVTLMILLTYLASLLPVLFLDIESFSFLKTTRLFLFSSISVYFFMAISLVSASFSGKINASLTANTIFFFSYMLGYLASLLGEKAEFLNYFSPNRLFSAGNLFAISTSTLVSIGVYVLLILLMIIAAIQKYNKRDFHL